MKKIITIILLAISPIALSQQNNRPTGSDTWFYKMGGADPYLNYRQSNRTLLPLQASAEWSVMKNCSFDPRLSIRETFSDLEQSVYGLFDDVVDSAVGAVQAWGLQQVQENWPGIYNFIMNGLVDAKSTYQVAVKTCRDYQNDLRNGRNPTEGWVSISRRNSWGQASEEGDNPVASEEEIAESAGDNGVPWVDGVNAGGDGQLPISVVADVITAGYDHLTAGENGEGSITSVFDDDDDLRTWASTVLGEREIRTCSGCQKLTSRIGQGLKLAHEEERQEVVADLIAIVETVNPTADQLDSISVPGTGFWVTLNTIRGLQNAPRAERNILMSRLSSEIALNRITERALALRELVNLGSQEPNIAANTEAQVEIRYIKERLDDELKSILFEQQVRETVLNRSSKVLSERRLARDLHERGATLRNNHDSSSTIEGGAVINE